MIRVIAKHEAMALFRTPLAWSLLAVVQFVLAYQFLAQIETYLKFEDKLRAMPEAPGVTEVVVTPTLGVAAMLLLFFAPILTMASISGERRNATLPLLLSSPITSGQIVIGKFVGIAALLCVLWVTVALMSLTLLWGAPIDIGAYLSGLLALACLGASYIAVGLMFSTLFTQPAVCAVMTFGLLSFLWLVDWATRLGEQAGALNYLSSLTHFQQMASGLLSSVDFVYFAALCISALAIAIWRLDGDRKPL